MTTRHSKTELRGLGICAALFFALIAFTIQSALAADLFWVGTVSTDWNNTNNWSPQQVPSASDHAIITNGNVTVTAGAVFAVMDWSGGSIAGNLTVASSAILNISGNAAKTLYQGATITNAGSVYWSGAGDLQYASVCSCFGAIENVAGSVFEVQNDQSLSVVVAYGGLSFHNEGLFRKIGGNGTTAINVPFNNDGTVEVNSGTIDLNSGGHLNGSFSAMGAAAVNFASGTFTLISGDPASSGAGSVQFTSDATISFSGPITNFNFTAGKLYGAAVLTGTMNWTGGQLYQSPLTVAASGVLNISGNGAKTLFQGATITNAGSVYWSGAGELQYASVCLCFGAIENLAGSVFEVQNDQSLSVVGYGGLSFNNAGLFRKTGGNGTTAINVPFNNDGTVEVNSGTIDLNSGGHLNGSFSAMGAAAVNFASGTFTLISGDPASSGAGSVQFTSDATISFSGPITNFNFTAGKLYGAAVLTGTMNWTGGQLYQSPLTVAASGVLNISGNGAKTLFQGATITNAGSVYWSGAGELQYASVCLCFGAIENLAGSVFEVQNDQSLSVVSYGGLSFNNAGLFRKTGGNGTTAINVPFNNDGTVEVDRGIVQMGSTYSNSASANLVSSLGGLTPGTDYGQIQFSRALALGGRLTVTTHNGYRPNPRDAFQVLSYPSATGTFACLNLDLGGGILLQPQFAPTILELAASSYSTNSSLPQLFIARLPGAVSVQWPSGFPGWVLQAISSPASTNWVTVTDQCGNQATLPTTEAQQFFRLRQGN